MKAGGTRSSLFWQQRQKEEARMYSRGGMRLAAAAAAGGGDGGGGFSSAAFTGDDGGEHAQRESTRAQHVGDANSNGSSSEGAAATGSSRPTIDTYRAMPTQQLETLLRTREQQVRKLQAIYENFHYEADKRFRTMVFDYHDKALQLSQVHGKMQLGSLQISREALVKMREQQEMYNRDHRLVLTVCTVFTFVFWVWVRRHYIRREDLDGTEAQLRVPINTRSVTGIGSYNENPFGSSKRSARNMETAWEREVRERQQQEQQQ